MLDPLLGSTHAGGHGRGDLFKLQTGKKAEPQRIGFGFGQFCERMMEQILPFGQQELFQTARPTAGAGIGPNGVDTPPGPDRTAFALPVLLTQAEQNRPHPGAKRKLGIEGVPGRKRREQRFLYQIFRSKPIREFAGCNTQQGAAIPTDEFLEGREFPRLRSPHQIFVPCIHMVRLPRSVGAMPVEMMSVVPRIALRQCPITGPRRFARSSGLGGAKWMILGINEPKNMPTNEAAKP